MMSSCIKLFTSSWYLSNLYLKSALLPSPTLLLISSSVSTFSFSVLIYSSQTSSHVLLSSELVGWTGCLTHEHLQKTCWYKFSTFDFLTVPRFLCLSAWLVTVLLTLSAPGNSITLTQICILKYFCIFVELSFRSCRLIVPHVPSELLDPVWFLPVSLKPGWFCLLGFGCWQCTKKFGDQSIVNQDNWIKYYSQL